TEEETTEEETSTSKTLTIGFSISANADVTPRSSADVYSGYIRNTDGDLVAINNIVIIYAEQLKTNTNYSAKVSDEEAGDYEVLINGTVPKGVTFKMENVIIEFNVNASHVTVESDFPSQVISGIEIPTTEFITTPIGEIQSGIMPNISSSPAGTKFRKSDGTFYTITN
ncbi:MAG: hypothetical protein PQJ46_07090, partial [Spirochaetales bacterium]|nr:hypothetical protein [Spirochaetales bacterium]